MLKPNDLNQFDVDAIHALGDGKTLPQRAQIYIRTGGAFAHSAEVLDIATGQPITLAQWFARNLQLANNRTEEILNDLTRA